ncbi:MULTISPECIES: hypothetical protein [Afipia]|nr:MULTISPECIES: hypothetical protein [Afipia]
MHNLTRLAGLLGSPLMLLTGRIAGITNIFGELLSPVTDVTTGVSP